MRSGFPMTAFAAIQPVSRAATVQKVRSPGGIEAWLVEDYAVPLVAIDFSFRGGSSQDPVGKCGTSAMMASLLDEGAGRLDSEAFPSRDGRQGDRDFVRRRARRCFGQDEDAQPVYRRCGRPASSGTERTALRPRCRGARPRADDRGTAPRSQGSRRARGPRLAGSRLSEPSLWTPGAGNPGKPRRDRAHRPRRHLPRLRGSPRPQDRGRRGDRCREARRSAGPGLRRPGGRRYARAGSRRRGRVPAGRRRSSTSTSRNRRSGSASTASRAATPTTWRRS